MSFCGSRSVWRLRRRYTDTGVTATLTGPPDANYDHANFYWRLELQPENAVNIESATTHRQQHAGNADRTISRTRW